MKYKNMDLNRVYRKHSEHLQILDKIIDFFSESKPYLFIGIDDNGDIHFSYDDIQAFIRVDMRTPAPLVCLHFILADYEDFQMDFYIGKFCFAIPIGAPKELMVFIDIMSDLRNYLNKNEEE